MRKSIILINILILIFASCEKDTVSDNLASERYSFLTSGTWKIVDYQINTISYNSIITQYFENTTFQFKGASSGSLQMDLRIISLNTDTLSLKGNMAFRTTELTGTLYLFMQSIYLKKKYYPEYFVPTDAPPMLFTDIWSWYSSSTNEFKLYKTTQITVSTYTTYLLTFQRQ